MADSVLAPWIFSALFNHRAVAADAAGRTVFVFPGHGSRWTDMAIELLEWAPAFASEMRACEIAFSKFFDWSLLDVVQGNAERPPSDRIDLSLPVSFAVMVSVAAQWRELGIHPDAVLGHSHGEVAAAYIGRWSDVERRGEGSGAAHHCDQFDCRHGRHGLDPVAGRTGAFAHRTVR